MDTFAIVRCIVVIVWTQYSADGIGDFPFDLRERQNIFKYVETN